MNAAAMDQVTYSPTIAGNTLVTHGDERMSALLYGLTELSSLPDEEYRVAVRIGYPTPQHVDDSYQEYLKDCMTRNEREKRAQVRRISATHRRSPRWPPVPELSPDLVR